MPAEKSDLDKAVQACRTALRGHPTVGPHIITVSGTKNTADAGSSPGVLVVYNIATPAAEVEMIRKTAQAAALGVNVYTDADTQPHPLGTKPRV